MNESLFKLELGCGKTKTEGYIGLDRFQLPGVDIVADLNKEFPINNDVADVIYACHSLEHLDNLEFTMKEIFRIGKHKCIVQILVPYYHTTLNMANFYHKNVFNEDTFRFFSKELGTNVVEKEDWYCPHASTFGLLGSDNSELSVELDLLHMEFFYYKEYLGLTNEEKRRARRSFNNVCDQIYYELVINKSDIPFTIDEINKIKARAKLLEPSIIQQLRDRDSNQEKAVSIYQDINKDLKNKVDKLEELSIKNFNYSKKQIDDIIEDVNNNKEWMKKVVDECKEKNLILSQQINSLQSNLQYARCQNDKYFAIILDLYKERENGFKSKLKLFRKHSDMFNSLQGNHTQFIDGVILNCNKFKASSILSLSKIIPYDGYVEYEIQGYGEDIYFFTISNVGAALFVEVVIDGKIVKQEHRILENDGIQKIKLNNSVSGRAFIRFKTTDNMSFIKVLEVVNRKYLVFKKIDLASFIL